MIQKPALLNLLNVFFYEESFLQHYRSSKLFFIIRVLNSIQRDF
jgi:hypothetical protein